MDNIESKIVAVNWDSVSEALHQKGYAIIPRLLPDVECGRLKEAYANDAAYRKTVVMERYRYGLGEYKYYTYPLPAIIGVIREGVYSRLAPVANTWMNALKIDTQFPATFPEMQARCHAAGQLKPTALILKYGAGGHNTLHQDLYGDVYFPMQTVLFLSEPGEDYTGGEFVLTEQVPRAQSKAVVLQPMRGDMLIFTTNFRPVKGSKGYYRANMKHGVSQIHNGERYTLGIIFHDALS